MFHKIVYNMYSYALEQNVISPKAWDKVSYNLRSVLLYGMY